MLYAQLTELSSDKGKDGGKHQANDGNVFFGFNTETLAQVGPLYSGELCSNMEVAYVGNTTFLLCVRFITNDIVKIDTSTGRPTTVLQLPPLHDPVGGASTVRNAPDLSSASYFIQLQGPTMFHWVEVDVASHRVVSNSSALIYGHIELAFTEYV